MNQSPIPRILKTLETLSCACCFVENRICTIQQKMTKIALLNIGTELLRGRTINTNAATIGQMLLSAGYALETTLVIHDDGSVIRAAFEELMTTEPVSPASPCIH